MILGLCKMPYGPGDSSFPFQGFTRTQFSLRVRFSITIKRAQRRCSKEAVGSDLTNIVISHGQHYVGLYRVTHPDQLTIRSPPFSDGKTRNFVYPEALV